jgi:mono/diheme cytochrome c family protein
MKRALLALTLILLLALTAAACGGDEATESATPAATPDETSSPIGPGTDQGAEVFADNCAGCHGSDGSGGSGPSIRGEDDVAAIKSQVENGGGSMPAFAGRLTAAEIEAVAQYVATELR